MPYRMLLEVVTVISATINVGVFSTLTIKARNRRRAAYKRRQARDATLEGITIELHVVGPATLTRGQVAARLADYFSQIAADEQGGSEPIRDVLH